MTREKAIAIIRKEYLCVDRDCNIERNCGKCELVMPSKEPILKAYQMAIKALEQEPCDDCVSRQQAMSEYADWFGYNYQDNWYYKCLKNLPSVTLQEPKTDVLDKIIAEIKQVKSIMNEEIINNNRKDLINFVNGLNQSLVIIDKHKAESEE